MFDNSYFESRNAVEFNLRTEKNEAVAVYATGHLTNGL